MDELESIGWDASSGADTGARVSYLAVRAIATKSEAGSIFLSRVAPLFPNVYVKALLRPTVQTKNSLTY